MIVLAGGDVVLPDRVLEGASLVIEGEEIADIAGPSRGRTAQGGAIIDLTGCFVVPGFVDVHVHGVDGLDTLDAGHPIADIAGRMPRYGVTGFCPTTVACGPGPLARMLAAVEGARTSRRPGAARVLPAHLESNFINPAYAGAQPAGCLRTPAHPSPARAREKVSGEDDFSALDILDVIASDRASVGIVTLAPELAGGVDLVRALVAAGHRVSLGHSGASFEEAIEAIDAGATRATHLFNRMTPMAHRAPGLPGAILAREDVTAELICDGYHVHPAMCRMAIRAKGAGGIMAITDGTAGSGLPPGSTARLGGRTIRVTDRSAVLEDGTLAGSTLTMDGAFRTLVKTLGLSIVEAATLCSTTPAKALNLRGLGAVAAGAIADLTVLDRSLRVVRTFVAGEEIYRSGATA